MPKRDDYGAGERRQIHHEFRLEALGRIPDHVGQHETTFGVGIDDLYGLPGHRGDDVTRPLRVTTRHVFDQANQPHCVDARLARGQRVHQTGDAGRTRHVALHVLHAGGRLDRDATAVETNAFADEGDRRVTFASTIPAHYHDAAIVGRSLRDAEQRVHTELAHRLAVENFDRDAELLQCTGPAGKLLRVEHVGRLVNEVTPHLHPSIAPIAAGYSAR